MDRIKSLCETLIRILGNHTMLIVCVVGLLAAVCLAYVVGNGIYKQFNPPVEVTTMSQEQAWNKQVSKKKSRKLACSCGQGAI